jgi:hypothetical protein
MHLNLFDSHTKQWFPFAMLVELSCLHKVARTVEGYSRIADLLMKQLKINDNVNLHLLHGDVLTLLERSFFYR